jgi:hypothetical protein
MLLVIPKMGDEEWDSGMFTVLLAVGRIVFGRIGDNDYFGWK